MVATLQEGVHPRADVVVYRMVAFASAANAKTIPPALERAVELVWDFCGLAMTVCLRGLLRERRNRFLTIDE